MLQDLYLALLHLRMQTSQKLFSKFSDIPTTHFPKANRARSKQRISKRVLQENKTRQIFQKMHISYPLIQTRVRIRGYEMFVFRKISRALVS